MYIENDVNLHFILWMRAYNKKTDFFKTK